MSLDNPRAKPSFDQILKSASGEAAAARALREKSGVTAEMLQKPIEQYLAAYLKTLGEHIDAFADAVNDYRIALRSAADEVNSTRNVSPEHIQKYLQDREAHMNRSHAERLSAMRNGAKNHLIHLGVSEAAAQELIDELVRKRVRSTVSNESL